MYLTANQTVCLIVEVSRQLYNQKFVDLAIKQWDQDGQGWYDLYLQGYGAGCWRHMARWN